MVNQIGQAVQQSGSVSDVLDVASSYEVQGLLITKPNLPEQMLQAKALADEAARGEADVPQK